ncbi:MAG: hypothetical protein IT236_13715 [Bacteroidia bacterium]|nr:hypothetical protein [Bacteroidia bacterium]
MKSQKKSETIVINTSTTLRGIKQFFVALVIGAGIFSCGEKKSEAIVAPEGMHIVDLSRYGKPFAIFVPDTVAAKLSITEQSSGALEIKVGKTFGVSINEQNADLALRKEDIKSDEVNKLKSFVKEEPNAIMWESAITEPEFHFIVNQKIGNSEYSFEDLFNSEGNTYGKDAVQKMFDSCKNIKEVKKETKS